MGFCPEPPDGLPLGSPAYQSRESSSVDSLRLAFYPFDAMPGIAPRGLGPVIPAETVFPQTANLLFARRSLTSLAFACCIAIVNKNWQHPERVFDVSV